MVKLTNRIGEEEENIEKNLKICPSAFIVGIHEILLKVDETGNEDSNRLLKGNQ